MGKQSWKPGNMLNPVPAVMVSVADEAHRPNIITVAWAGTICTNPPMVSISIRPSRYSYDIIEKNRRICHQSHHRKTGARVRLLRRCQRP